MQAPCSSILQFVLYRQRSAGTPFPISAPSLKVERIDNAATHADHCANMSAGGGSEKCPALEDQKWTPPLASGSSPTQRSCPAAQHERIGRVGDGDGCNSSLWEQIERTLSIRMADHVQSHSARLIHVRTIPPIGHLVSFFFG